MKRNKIFAAISILLAGTTSTAFAQSFCGDRPNIVYSGENEHGLTISSNTCMEIGAGDFNTPTQYAGSATDFTIEDGGRLNVTGYIDNSKINDGGTLWIQKNWLIGGHTYNQGAPALGTNLTVNTGADVRVFQGGTIQNSLVDGGTVYISMDPVMNNEAGHANNVTVQAGGKLYVFNQGANSDNTIINAQGTEYIQQNATSNNTTVNAGGLQYVQLSGKSVGTIINTDGRQYVLKDGIADQTIVYGQQYIYNAGTQNTAGTATNTRVYGSGQQIVQNGASATGVELNNNSKQIVYTTSSTRDVTINDNAISWIDANAQILGHTSINDQGQLQLVASQNDTGAYAQDVILNSENAQVVVIGNTGNTNSAHIGSLSGSGQVHFTPANNTRIGTNTYSQLNIDNLSGNQHFFFNTSIGEGYTDYLNIQQGSGSHKVSVQDSGVEITQPGTTSLNIISDQSGGADFTLADLQGLNINAVDGGTYMYSLHERIGTGAEKIWYLGAAPETGTDLETPSITPPPLTTPATDAVLSMSTAPALVLSNDMENLRFRRGELRNNADDAGLWGRVTGAENKIDSDHIHMKIQQTGAFAGIDQLIPLDQGKAFIGATGSYNNTEIKHARGGSSQIDSYGIGVYGTYMDDNGLYIDGTLRYSHFNNNLHARSTNGLNINGDYKQNGVGASIEVGYYKDIYPNLWVEPYGRLSLIRVGSEKVILNNGMTANMGAYNSVTTELGASLGTNYTFKDGSIISPYVRAAWVHEYTNSNNVVINHFNSFSTDLSGDRLKLGLGVNTQLSEQIALYGEIGLGWGNKIDTPIKFNLGLRYSF